MGYFPVRYDSIVVIYESKFFIRLATGDRVQTIKKYVGQIVSLAHFMTSTIF